MTQAEEEFVMVLLDFAVRPALRAVKFHGGVIYRDQLISAAVSFGIKPRRKPRNQSAWVGS